VKKRFVLFCTVALLAIAMLVTGCGGSNDKENEGTSGAGKAENILVWGLAGCRCALRCHFNLLGLGNQNSDS